LVFIKKVNNADAGTATKLGGNDWDALDDYFAGVATGRTADIDSITKFRDDRLKIQNPANTFSYKFSTSPIVADRTIDLPTLTGNDVFTFNSFAATLSNKTLDSTCIVDSASLASDVVKEGITNDFGDFDNSFKDNRIRIWNPADTFRYTLVGQAITANRNLQLPIITATDTLATLGLSQTFIDRQKIQLDTSNSLLALYRPANGVGGGSRLDFNLNDSGSVETTYCRIQGSIEDATDTSEDGVFRISTVKAGTVTENCNIGSGANGDFIWGNNLRGLLSESGLTGQRTFTFPDLAGEVATRNNGNDFTVTQEIKVDGGPDALDLYRTDNVAADAVNIDFNLDDSTNAKTGYARIEGAVVTNTDTLEDGKLNFRVRSAGSLGTQASLESNGTFRCGGPNRRVTVDETGLTAQRTFTFGDATSKLVGLSYANDYGDFDNSFKDNRLRIWNPADTFRYTVIGSAITADRNITLPLASSSYILPAYIQSGATNDINTTAAETDMLNYSVVGNQLGANGSVRFTITGYLLQNQATGTTYTFAVKFGTTNLWADVSPTIAQSATKIPFRIVGEVFNKNATNAQGVSGYLIVQDTTAATTGLGDISSDTNTSPPAFSGNFDSEGADTAKDTTSAQTLQVTVTMSVSNSAVHTVVKHTLVEVLPAA